MRSIRRILKMLHVAQKRDDDFDCSNIVNAKKNA